MENLDRIPQENIKPSPFASVTVAADELSFPVYWKDLQNLNILEIGSGAGRHTQKLVDRNHVTGIDISQALLTKAREKIESKNLELIHGDFMSYEDFHHNEFGAIICSLVVAHFTNLNVFFQKIYRILSPGGKIFISEIHPDSPDTSIVSHAHSEEQMALAASTAGLSLLESGVVFGTEELAQLNVNWRRFVGAPLVKIYIFQK